MSEESLVIPKIFRDTVSKFPEKIVLQIKKDNQWLKITYRELEEFALKVGAFLLKEGFKKGDYAVIILENRPEWTIIYLGIMFAGLTCVPQDPQLSPKEIKNLVLDSGSKLIFCSQEIFTQKIKYLLPEHLMRVVVLDAVDEKDKNLTNFSDIKHISIENIVWPDVSADDIASLIYTSGTTGQPKGVLLSQRNICSNFKSIQKLNLCLPSDNFLSILPLYHSYAFMVTLIVPIFLGATVTYCLSFNPKDFTQIIQEGGVTILVGVPQLFLLLHKAIIERIKRIPLYFRPFIFAFMRIRLRRFFGSLRISVCGGARLEPKICRDLNRWGLKLVEGYGLTETSPVVTLNPLEKIKFGSVGRAIPDVQIKISQPDKSGVGEILIKGPNVMPGYFRQPQLTSQVIKEGWLYTGDLGYLDKDGYLFLVGRKKEIIILSSGKNIYPEELEEYYSQAPSIKEICIILQQEKIFGHLKDSLYAIIVPNLELFTQRKESNIYEKIRWDLETLGKDLPSYKHILGFTLTKDQLPRTVLKKIKRYEVREKYFERKFYQKEFPQVIPLKEDAEILNKELAEKIINYLSKELNRPIYLDEHLEIDLGIDSLTRVELGLGLEALLGIEIPDELIYSISTVKDCIIHIQNLVKEPQGLIQRPLESVRGWDQILRESPSQTILERIKIDCGWLDKLLTWIFKNIFLFLLRIFWSLRIEGRDHLPRKGPYLICPNHASFLDGFFIFSCLPFKISLNTFFLGYHYIFGHPSISWAIKIARLIPIDTSVHLTEAMQAVSFVLLHNKIVCIFPEGMRSIDTEIKEFKKGVGILIKELDIPVVPVYIKGSHQTWPRGRRLPKPYPVKVVFGWPVTLKELLKLAQERRETTPFDYETVALALRQEVLRLRW